MSSENEKSANKLELFIGLFIAFFAAATAINDLGAGKFGNDEMIYHNQQTKMYNWYQSKSVKQSIIEGQRDLLKSFETSGTIAHDKIAATQVLIDNLNKDIERYKKEKKEILLGSAKVGKENWAQDVDGKLGLIIGANEYETLGDKMGEAGDIFDIATLFLQISLVLGAVSLILNAPSTSKIFMYLMFLTGFTGCFFMLKAFSVAL